MSLQRAQALRPTSLDPAVLDRLSKLSLVARTVVEGFMAGGHVSPHRGSSVEFAQHREYVPGDDLRFLDEKIYAKSNRLVVKEFVEETNFACHILVDCSASMRYGSSRWSKLDYARWAAAALAYLVLNQRDTAGLVLFDEQVRDKVPPHNGAAQAASILASLERAEAQGETGVGDVLDWIGTRLRHKGIVVILSDFFDEPQHILEGTRRLRIAGHEPILMQVVDPRELDFDFDGHLRLDALEGAERMKVDAKSLRKAYREEVEAHAAALAHGANSLGIDLVTLRTDAPLDVVLSTYLARRQARARGGARG
ncbi:DUF58 domain-containing protein [Engelhardtia mirabilis]|uniref:DUF58 domain-containing protein n=1 Tax=Engelhardtia mirabilis TaxID=2528011 RepID=A0A518BMM1_9BACT|nr:hypothetical protein Pla133_33230 [Planctomycetes bacterium Pla133]QDV02554.1 hypothetical protein Pla86_33220 [Planctomycetes bacterium Pla86]